ncbi:PEPxxWA-CTERM sorting domain-containing protein [Sphingomonas nostoxanthinifaciens]|nr:PEPxxWA-CTERM sorting domain-containing protein [Sphingomonas nostoxanthinifaciens]
MMIGATQAQALSYSGLYVFGDSLVDAGNAYYGTMGAQASPANGYYNGRFSNGYNFADYVGELVTGAPTQPFLTGGDNVAVGGALTQYVPGESSPSFPAQLTYFLGSPAPTIASDALVLVTFGGNDVRATATTGGTVDFTAASTTLLTGLETLYGLGARNFVIVGSPDIGLLPSAQPLGAIPGRLDALSKRSRDISALFAGDATTLDALPGTDVTFFDLYDWEHDLLDNLTAYGLGGLDTTTPCQVVGGGSPQLSNCANSLYFDGIHPTTQIHKLIGEAIVGELAGVPEPASWGMMILGFGAIGWRLRRREPAGAAVIAA